MKGVNGEDDHLFFGYRKLSQRGRDLGGRGSRTAILGVISGGRDEALGSHLKVQGPRSLELLALDMHMGTAT